MESCRNLVHFICDFTKKDRIHFYLTTLDLSAFDTVQGRSFYSPVRWFISVSDFCSTLLHIHTEKRTLVFYADGSDCKTKYIVDSIFQFFVCMVFFMIQFLFFESCKKRFRYCIIERRSRPRDRLCDFFTFQQTKKLF